MASHLKGAGDAGIALFHRSMFCDASRLRTVDVEFAAWRTEAPQLRHVRLVLVKALLVKLP